MGVCKQCGKPTLGTYEYCLNCKPKSSNPGPNPRSGGYSQGSYGRSLPAECIFKDSFYASDGYLKREIFIEAADKASRIFQDEGMTQTSIRHLFNMLKSIEMRLRTDKSLPLGFVRENFYRFVTHSEYQTKRGVLKEIFREFIDAHRELAVKDIKEFKGFVEYLTSIVARMKQK